MELQYFIPIFATLLLGVVVSHAALPSEVYWQNVLPNTPMPKVVHDLLRPDYIEAKNTNVDVGKGGVHVDTKKPGGSSTNVGVGKGGVVVDNQKPGGKGTAVNVGKGGVHVGTSKPGGGTTVNVGHKGGVGVDTGKPGGRTKVIVGKGGVGVDTGHKGKPVIVRVHPGPNPFQYKYAASADQLEDDPNSALFFLEKDLYPGSKMNLHFIKTTNGATFLPHQLAKSTPFSSNKLQDILNRFSVDPKSVEAEAIKKTINECEEPSNDNEDKYCATSLESMVDFSTSKLGTNVRALATEVVDKEKTQKQQYVITSGVKRMPGDNSVVCHSQSYLYAVFYCHTTRTTKAYMVPLVGADGTKIKAVAVCHTDTSTWNPKHLAFQVLRVKPGTVPVCHFLPEDHIVWVSKN